MPENDLQTHSDIVLLVNTFYGKVKQDEVLKDVFQQIIGDDWSHHLPIMYQFWETVLLNKPGYSGNPIKKHIEIDKKIPLTDVQFEQWLVLWKLTVDELFAGPKAEEAKTRAGLMLQLIRFKTFEARKGNSIL